MKQVYKFLSVFGVSYFFPCLNIAFPSLGWGSIPLFFVFYFIIVNRGWIHLGKFYLINSIISFFFIGTFGLIPNYFKNIPIVEDGLINKELDLILLNKINIPQKEQVYVSFETEESRSASDYQQKYGESDDNYRRRLSSQKDTITKTHNYSFIPIYSGDKLIALGMNFSTADWSDMKQVYFYNYKKDEYSYQQTLFLSENPKFKDIPHGQLVYNIYPPLWKVILGFLLPLLYPFFKLKNKKDWIHLSFLDFIKEDKWDFI